MESTAHRWEIRKESELSAEDILAFLKAADHLFPVPLSEKTRLAAYAVKLKSFGTIYTARISAESDAHRDVQPVPGAPFQSCREAQAKAGIVGMLAGYLDHVQEETAYISIVSVLPDQQGRGIGGALLDAFLKDAGKKGLRGVHVYAVRENLPAMSMYERAGFHETAAKDLGREGDVHFEIVFRRQDRSR